MRTSARANHPETGRKALYIGNHTQTFDGLARRGAADSDFLMTHAVQPEFTCRFRWEVDLLAIWDNRCTQHRALNDYPQAPAHASDHHRGRCAVLRQGEFIGRKAMLRISTGLQSAALLLTIATAAQAQGIVTIQ